MPAFSAKLSEPFAPLTVTPSALIAALTPCGRSTGFFATRDMIGSLNLGTLLNYEQYFAARTRGARLTVRHDAFGRRNHRDAKAAEHLRQFVLAAIDAQP